MTKLLKKAQRKARHAIAITAATNAVADVHHGLVTFRKYQEKVFWDHETKTLIIHWSRQIGKSYTLAGWAVDRLLKYPGRLVTVLSNSRANGQEFVLKCQEVCRKLGQAMEMESNNAALDQRTDLSEDMKYDMMRGEVRITVEGQVGRILVLAANPRTARGFSGDLILDEFAFHENSQAIWEAAEPIISSNPDFLCRIASTGNGKRNMFYQLISEGRMPYYRVRRSDAFAAGEIKIYSAVTGKEITPAQARAEASDKRAYDQNYECMFNDENSALLTQELINAAQREGVLIEDQEWSEATLIRLATQTIGDLYLGQDVEAANIAPLSMGQSVIAGVIQYLNEIPTLAQRAQQAIYGIASAMSGGISSAITGLINRTMTWRDALLSIGQAVVQSLIGAFANMVAQWIAKQLLMALFGKAIQAAQLAALAPIAAATALMWAPAATAASIATLGGAAIEGAAMAKLAILSSVIGFATGGIVPGGEQLIRINEQGTEAVLNARATAMLGPGFINAANAGAVSLGSLSGSIAGQLPVPGSAAPLLGDAGAQAGQPQVKIYNAFFSDQPSARQWLNSKDGQKNLIRMRGDIGLET